MIHKYPHVCAAIVIGLLWAVLFFSAGTPFIGYQLVDDHEQVEMQADMKAPGTSSWAAAWTWMKKDFGIRFRPFYYAHRLALTALIGTHWTLWQAHQEILAVLTSLLLFAFCYRLGFTWMQSLLLPFLTLLGAQTAVYWRLGPQEALGMFLVALSLFFMALSATAERRRGWHGALFLLSATLAALCKESFVLLLPALAFWKVWLTKSASDGQTWRQAVQCCKATIAGLFVVCILCLGVIFGVVGTHGAAYAGGRGIHPLTALTCLWAAFSRFELYVLGTGIFLLGCSCLANRKRAHPVGRAGRKTDPDAQPTRPATTLAGDLLPAGVLVLLILLPQGVMYGQNMYGMFERYRLPAALGIAIGLLWVWRRLVLNRSWLAPLFLTILLAHVGWQGLVAYGTSRGWTGMARVTEGFLAAVEQGTTPEAPILIVGDPARNNEAVLAVRDYLSCVAGRRDLSVLSVFAPPYDPYEQSLIAQDDFQTWFPSRVLTDTRNLPPFACVVVLPGADQPFLQQRPAWLQSATYDRMMIGWNGGFVVYSRKAPN